MTATRAIFLVAALLAALPFSARAGEKPAPPVLEKEDHATLRAGDVIVRVTESDKANRGEVIGIIQAPPEEVFPFTRNCGTYGEWAEAVTDTAILRRKEWDEVVCRGTARVPFPARNRHGHFLVINGKQTVGDVDSYLSTYGYIQGSGNFNDMFGYWLVQPYGPNGEQTILKFVLNVDIGGWLPDFLVRWATRRVLPNVIYGLRYAHGKARGVELGEPKYWLAQRR